MEGNLIEEFFGKSDGITKEDLENFLKDANESILLEFKEIREPKQAKDLILKSLVGFLNSAEGRGLLIVGVSDDKQIKGVHRDHLDEQKIRNWIRDGIDSVPRAIVAPYFRIVKVKTGDDTYIHLIEVRRKDDVVYFSRESGCAYIRVGASTNRLNLNESLDLVAKKSLAKPYVVFKCEIKQDPNSRDNIELILEPILKNIGSKPAFYVIAVIDVAGGGILNSRAEGSGITKIKDHEFQVNAGFIPLSAPVYPTEELVGIAPIILEINPILSSKIKIKVRCYEMEVMSYAEYEINLTSSMSGEIIEPIKKEFRPYTTLGSLQ